MGFLKKSFVLDVGGIDLRVLNDIYEHNGRIKATAIVPIVKLLNISCNTFLFK